MDKKYKHLCLIENIIDRMARNSFTLKGWALSLIVLIGSFAAQGTNQKYILMAWACFPLICFWLLDAFYLQIERKYRFLYKDVQKKKEKDIDFNLDFEEVVLKGKDIKKLCYCRCLLSFSECVFYVPVAVGVIILIYLLRYFT